jgi:leucyl aminopeptidase (aminopeptidase T)
VAAAVSAESPSLGRDVARIVLEKTLRVRKGDNVTVETWSETLPWAKPFIAEARRKGAHPMLLYEDESTFWESIADGSGARATGRVGSHEWSALSKTSAYVFFFGPSEWTRYDELPDTQADAARAYNGAWYRAAARAKIRGARMYIGRTSARAAQRWGVDLDAWREELLRASLVSPEELHREGSRVGERLRRGKTVTVRHPNGTDLTFRLGRYPLQLDDAMVDEADLRAGNNMATIPGGVVGVSIDHTSASGTVVGNRDVYPQGGRVSDPRWTFASGRLTDAAYGAGGHVLEEEYAEAPAKGRDRLSYFSIGLNRELARSPQMEDQERGAVLLRLGGNRFAGGRNASPFSAWLVVKGANVAIDGKPLLEGGQIV